MGFMDSSFPRMADPMTSKRNATTTRFEDSFTAWPEGNKSTNFHKTSQLSMFSPPLPSLTVHSSATVLESWIKVVGRPYTLVGVDDPRGALHRPEPRT